MKALVWKGVGKVAVEEVPRPAIGSPHEAFIKVTSTTVNTLKVPAALSDEQVLFLSDIVCTGWHATELGRVHKGDTVAVWGCGPVG